MCKIVHVQNSIQRTRISKSNRLIQKRVGDARASSSQRCATGTVSQTGSPGAHCPTQRAPRIAVPISTCRAACGPRSRTGSSRSASATRAPRVCSRSVQNAKPGKSQKNNELRRGSKILVGSGMAKKPISTGPQRAFPVEICEQTPFLTHLHLSE